MSDLARLHVEIESAQDRLLTATGVQRAHAQGAGGRRVAVAHAGVHRCSRRRAMRESGSDIARYTIAQSAPGMAQLPALVA